jgi:hypothetical protein
MEPEREWTGAMEFLEEPPLLVLPYNELVLLYKGLFTLPEYLLLDPLQQHFKERHRIFETLIPQHTSMKKMIQITVPIKKKIQPITSCAKYPLPGLVK